MKSNFICKDISEDLFEYFEKNPDSLPDGIQINTVNIIGDLYSFPEKGKTVLENWLVIFKNQSGIVECKMRYNLTYEGLKLIFVRKVNSGSLPILKMWNTNPNYS